MAPLHYSSLLNPQDSVLVLIDHQPMTLFGVQSHDRQTVVDNVVSLAKTAKAFGVPVILTTVAENALGGRVLPELRELFPDQEVIDRTWINSWEDPRLRDAVLATNRRQIVMAGLWTEMCLAFAALSAREEGREVFAVADASGGATLEAHDLAVQRMVQAGVVPLSTQVVLGELQRDWGRTATAAAASDIAKEYYGAWGQVLTYYKDVVGGPTEETGHRVAVASGD